MANDYSLGDASLSTSVDLSGLRAGLDQGEQDARGWAGVLQTALGTALGIGLQQAVTAGLSGLRSVIGTALGEAMDAQAGMAQLDAVLASTGGAAGVTRDEILALSSSLSAANGLSKFSDDAILSANNLLLTFTNIGRDVFPAASQAAIDMAAALGGEPQSQAIALGKALNDPVAGITALTRVGVTFTEEQKAVIESLVETGRVSEAQQIILAELGREFGGSAAAAAGTFSGQLITLQEQFNGILEGVGNQLIPSLQEFTSVLSSPAVMGAITQIADGIGSALGTAIEWLANTAIPAFVGAWEAVGPAIETAGAVISSLAGDAFAWGENIVASLAAGIGAAVSYVVDALSSVGSVIQYWLEPGSPPKLLPDIDVWGRGAASAWADGFADADLSAFDTLAGSVEQTLRGMAASGALSEDGLIPAILGSRQAVGDALAELARTGTISEASFTAIRESAGAAGADVEELTRRYLALRQASEKTSDAQAELDAALADDAALKSQTMIPVAAMEASKARIAAAREGLKTAKADEAQAKDQYGTQQALIEQQQKTNDLLVEEKKRQEQSAKATAGGASAKSAADKEAEKAAKDAERQAKAAKQAQDNYNLSVADTDGKLAILRGRLETLNPSQAEYWQTLGQIAQLESQQAKDRERDAKTQEADQKKVADAQWAHQYAVASNEEKLKMLQDRLKELNPAQSEYWSTLTQISQMENQIARDREKAGGAGGGGVGNMPDLTKLPKLPGAGDEPGKKGLDRNPIKQLTKQIDDALATVEAAKRRIEETFNGILAIAQPIWQAISEAITTRLEQVRSFIVEIMPGIQIIITDVLTAIQTFWATHGADIVATAQTAWNQIGVIIDLVAEIIRVVVLEKLALIHAYFVDNSATIQAVTTTAWTLIQAAIQTVLAAIEIIVRTALAVVSGDWATQITAMKTTGETLFNGIKTFFGTILAAIAGLFNTNLAAIKTTWESNFNALKTIAETVWGLIQTNVGTAIATVKGEIDGLITKLKEALAPALSALGGQDGILTKVKGWWGDVSGAIGGVITKVGEFVTALANVDIPDWLEGNSPPPLADWFRWSGEAAAGLNAELPQLKTGLNGPSLPSLGGGGHTMVTSRVIVHLEDGRSSLLRDLIRVEVREQTREIAMIADARRRS